MTGPDHPNGFVTGITDNLDMKIPDKSKSS